MSDIFGIFIELFSEYCLILIGNVFKLILLVLKFPSFNNVLLFLVSHEVKFLLGGPRLSSRDNGLVPHKPFLHFFKYSTANLTRVTYLI